MYPNAFLLFCSEKATKYNISKVYIKKNFSFNLFKDLCGKNMYGIVFE